MKPVQLLYWFLVLLLLLIADSRYGCSYHSKEYCYETFKKLFHQVFSTCVRYTLLTHTLTCQPIRKLYTISPDNNIICNLTARAGLEVCNMRGECKGKIKETAVLLKCHFSVLWEMSFLNVLFRWKLICLAKKTVKTLLG